MSILTSRRRRAYEDVPERQAPRGQPSLHRRKNCVSRNQAQTLARERVTRRPPTLDCGSTAFPAYSRCSSENPLVYPDNNAAERALRGPVVGRKNHYGSRSKRGTEVAALFYTWVFDDFSHGRRLRWCVAMNLLALQDADPSVRGGQDEVFIRSLNKKALLKLRRRAQRSSAMQQLTAQIPEAELFLQGAFDKGE